MCHRLQLKETYVNIRKLIESRHSASHVHVVVLNGLLCTCTLSAYMYMQAALTDRAQGIKRSVQGLLHTAYRARLYTENTH